MEIIRFISEKTGERSELGEFACCVNVAKMDEPKPKRLVGSSDESDPVKAPDPENASSAAQKARMAEVRG